MLYLPTLRFLSVLILCMACSRAAGVEFAVFQQGVSDAGGSNASFQSDNTQMALHQISGQFTTQSAQMNWGAQNFMEVGKAFAGRLRGLYRFDLSSLQGRVDEVTSARLVLTLRRVTIEEIAFNPADGNLRLYEISSGNADWVEGTANGGYGDFVCWAGRQGPGLPWIGQPGCAMAGTDFVTTPAALNPVAESFTAGAKWTFYLPNLAMIDAWIENPAANGGLLLRAEGAEAVNDSAIVIYNFHSDDATNAAFRPRLEVDYIPHQAGAGGAWLLAP